MEDFAEHPINHVLARVDLSFGGKDIALLIDFLREVVLGTLRGQYCKAPPVGTLHPGIPVCGTAPSHSGDDEKHLHVPDVPLWNVIVYRKGLALEGPLLNGVGKLPGTLTDGFMSAWRGA